jgi:hypothetical protein
MHTLRRQPGFAPAGGHNQERYQLVIGQVADVAKPDATRLCQVVVV